MQLRTLIVFAFCALAPQAPAQDADYLYFLTESGDLWRGFPDSDHYEQLPYATSTSSSLATWGERVFIGHPAGFIERFSESTQTVLDTFVVPNNATSLTASAFYLYVGGEDGTVLWYIGDVGVLVASFDAETPVSAMREVGSSLFVGSDSGEILLCVVGVGDFSTFAQLGAGITALTHDANDLIVADSAGWIRRFDMVTGTPGASFQLGAPVSAMAERQGVLIMGDSQGRLLRVDAQTGANLGSVDVGFEGRLSGMEIGIGAAAAMPYCFGQTSCPCGNPSTEGGCANSTGLGALLSKTGSTSIIVDDLALNATNVPSDQFGLFFMSDGEDRLPFGDGLLCVGIGGQNTARFPVQNAGSAGLLSEGPGIAGYTQSHFPPSLQIQAGQTWYFQAWFRDPSGPCGAGFNTSNAMAINFLP